MTEQPLEELDQRTPALSQEAVARDIDLMLWAFQLLRIRRYVHQPYWDFETAAAEAADRLEDFPRMETVAEHSWTVADAVILLAPNFPYIHRGHAVELAVLHDKMEIVTGDANPLGIDGTGDQGHAFNPARQADKFQQESAAIEWFTDQLRPPVAKVHFALLMESLKLLTPEARFVRAVDKMQALAFILLKKQGRMDDRHLTFLIRYTDKNDRVFPPLRQHSQELLRRIFRVTAELREVTAESLWRTASQGIQATPEKPAPVAPRSPLPPNQGTHNSRFGRIMSALSEVGRRPPARTGLEAYRQMSDALNRIEDLHWGDDHWSPPRHVGPGVRTDRLYPIAPENIYPVPGFPGVDLLASVGESVFISRTGAVQVQRKRAHDLFGMETEFAARKEDVIFDKADAAGRHVWHEDNRR